ncbi:MAG TPA: lysylphosphatidylglycerol synthase domain-containing protein [Bacteroidales bacterium]|nr:lysylphosphatidylglycerol synthase domain-containing protein [Bacteroidales bacterium]
MNKKILKYLISIIIIVLSYGFIYHKLKNHEALKNFTIQDFKITRLQITFVAILFIGMILNWSIEAIKWKVLVKKITQIHFLKSLQIIIASITIGIFTPNRIGEIAGRAYFLEKGKRTYGLLVAGIGSFAQLTATVIMGLIGFSLFLICFPEKIHINSLFNEFTALLILVFTLGLVWVFFNVQKIKPILLKIPYLRKKTEQINFLSHQSKKSLLAILFYSFLRYFIFSFQFYLLLLIFNVQISFLESFVAITLTYFFMTLIPTTTLAELGVRGSLSIFFIGMFTQQIPGIILATIFIWIINIAIPAITGAPFLLIHQK